ncbi:MAG: hypothetical protein CMK65_08860 [Pseudoalteromonas sp.]|uniref:pPIWI-associating nuclease domain-containing protein n=1 Tax=Pseudoalteromonas sp. TaxID=53249 RepID=UPI000C983025|nr:hypothetical protein [Pseudoalteromonas sp.]MAD03715.1 hypothetical protein [Pseudoalteromonas sp.]|tara:strand:+ start:26599 stop:27585 length:987 start_codon:yes stop_codon:yes gene_type:complete
MYVYEHERKLSRRRRKKMAKVQQRKQNKAFRQDKFHRTAIYKHLISSANSVKIQEHLGSGFERELFLASLNNLSDKGNPLRFNNFAYCMREIITLILAKYSSDEDILNCCWYRNETNKDNGVTRAQRAKYAIQGGFSDDIVLEILQVDEEEEKDFIEDTLKQFTKLFRELNGHTHLREKRFNIGDVLCESLAFQVLSVMDSILTLIENLREQVKSYVEGEIDDALISEFVGSTFNELDILSTHTFVDYSELESYYVSSICSKHVVIKGDGIVYCDLQWGSGSDMRNGIGASMSTSFPYDFTIYSKLTDLKKMELGNEGITVDTDSWYE